MNSNLLKSVKLKMKDAGLDAIFVSNPRNVKYLTGFKTTLPGDVQSFSDPEGFVLVHSQRVDFLCDGRYINVARQIPGVTAQLLETPLNPARIGAKVRELLPEGAKNLGFERDAVTHADAVEFLGSLGGLAIEPAESIFVDIRLRKSPEEIALLRTAEKITSDCYRHAVKAIRAGMSERDLALEIDNYLRSKSDGCSFETIVAFGETACNPHYVPDPKRKLKKGQLVLMDLGSIYQGYCGDMTRVVCFGKADARQREVYDIVLEAQLAGLSMVRPGAKAHDIDMAVRGVFEKHNCLDRFLHGTGHGIGLAVHEPPWIKHGFDTVIEPGMAFSVEPGLYYPGWGGVRIEDLVVVTDSGHENITKAPKKGLVEVGVAAPRKKSPTRKTRK
jgi:Xaa-Pro aminopeptidase